MAKASNRANPHTDEPTIETFAIKDCALSAIATGRRAQNLRELRDGVAAVDLGSIYYHFWGGLLRPRFDDPEYNNDFASWSRHMLHDTKLAERLGVIDPAEYSDMNELRQEVIDVIEERLEDSEFPPWSKPDQQFHFIRAQTVVFDTHLRIKDPKELAGIVPKLSVGSIYYHVIDSRRRAPQGLDDFRAWLMQFDARYGDLIARLADVDPYFVTLTELREQLTGIFSSYDFSRKTS